jgi:hypothetical protein
MSTESNNQNQMTYEKAIALVPPSQTLGQGGNRGGHLADEACGERC